MEKDVSLYSIQYTRKIIEYKEIYISHCEKTNNIHLMDIIKRSLAASCDFFIYTRAVYPLIKHCNVRNKAHYGNNCAQSWTLDAPILRQGYIKRFVQLLLLRTIVLPSFHISDLESAAHSLNRSRPSLALFSISRQLYVSFTFDVSLLPTKL